MPNDLVQKDKDRLQHIDLLEALAIFFVVIYHGNISLIDFLGRGEAVRYINYALRGILSTCVPLFFFANGYLLLNRPFDLKKHVLKTLRLVVITMIWAVLHVVILGIIHREHMTLMEMGRAVWTWKEGWLNHLWFMGTLVCIYILFPMLKMAFDGSRKVFVYFLCAAAILTFGNTFLNMCFTLGMDVVFDRESLWRINLFNRFNPFPEYHDYAWVYFCLGGLMPSVLGRLESVSRTKRSILAAAGILLASLGLGFWGIYCSRVSGEPWDLVYDAYNTVFTLVNVLCLFVLSLNYKGQHDFLRRGIALISVNTMGIYFIHELYIHMTRMYVQTITPLHNAWGEMVYGIVILAVSLMTSLLLKKIPILKRLVL